MITILSFIYNEDQTAVKIVGIDKNDEDKRYQINAPIFSDFATVKTSSLDPAEECDNAFELSASCLFDMIRISPELLSQIDTKPNKFDFNNWLRRNHGITEYEIPEDELNKYVDQFMVYVYELPSFFAGAIVREKMLHG